MIEDLVQQLIDRLDHQFYALAQGTISGHTVKHLVAAGATIFAIPMWLAGRAATGAADAG